MTTAREIMTHDVTCIGESEAARKMAQLGVGSLPICGNDDRLKGVLTDRDIVVKVLAKGRDPQSVAAGELAQGEAITIGADDDAAAILRTMGQHQVRRLPVIDGHKMVASWPSLMSHGRCPTDPSASSSTRSPSAEARSPTVRTRVGARDGCHPRCRFRPSPFVVPGE